MEPDQTEPLCSRCRAIDLEKLFQNPKPSSTQPRGGLVLDERQPAFNLGRLTPQWESSECSICQLFLSIILLCYPHQKKITELEYGCFRGLRFYRTGPNGPRPVIFVKPISTLIHMNLDEKDEVFVNFIKQSDVPRSNAYQVDYEPLRNWYNNICNTTKPDFDNPAVEISQSELPCRVIDSETRKLVSFQDLNTNRRQNIQYWTLSYVWGQSTLQLPVMSPGSMILPTRIPRAVDDAITVVQKLGGRYLWVDRYCLDQDHKATFQAQLNAMGSIYSNALVNIIAAAGADADYGLPGVSSCPRILRQCVRLGERALWSSMQHPLIDVKNSTWMKRGWTYQEGAFSRRWLAFTDEQCLMRSPQGGTDWLNCELFGSLGPQKQLCPTAEFTRDMQDDSAVQPHGADDFVISLKENLKNNPAEIHSHLKRYTQRSLTSQSDILNGFLGFFRKLKNGTYPLKHYFGIPIIGMIDFKDNEVLRTNHGCSLTEALVNGLCWAAGSPGMRRSGFPSWSWTGWETIAESPPLHIRLDGCFHTFETTAEPDVMVWNTQNNRLERWETWCKAKSWDIYQDVNSLPQRLTLNVPVIRGTLEYCSFIHNETSCSPGIRSMPEGKEVCIRLQDDECDILVITDLTDESLSDRLKSGHVEEVKCLVMKQHIPPRDQERADNMTPTFTGFALLVSQETRVGTVRPYLGTLHNARHLQDGTSPGNYEIRWKTRVDHSKFMYGDDKSLCGSQPGFEAWNEVLKHVDIDIDMHMSCMKTCRMCEDRLISAFLKGKRELISIV
jgi:hypothetical protein